MFNCASFTKRYGTKGLGFVPPDCSQSPLHDARVLVVEDDPIIAYDTAEILRAAGAHIVGPIFNLESAVLAARSQPLSAAILDIRLKEATVFPVAEVLVEREVPFAFYTGNGSELTLKKDWPGCLVINKPVTPKVLVATVRTLLQPMLEGSRTRAPDFSSAK